MKKNVSFIDEFAVSEVVGAMILVLIAIVAFAAIYMYVFPLPLPAPEPNVKLMGYVNEDGTAVIEHVGGESLLSYKIYADGKLVYQNDKDSWKIGECITPPLDKLLLTENDKVNIDVYEINKDGSENQVFTGILTGKGKVAQPYMEPMLISSLNTNTIDEDLICYNHTINPNIHALTYIYDWSVNGNPIMNLLMSFDRSSSTIAKDYSGNGHNGTVIGPIWINGGRVGGAYQFNGVNDHISIPYCFPSSTIDKITVETWIKTTANSGVIASFDRNNYWELGFINGKVRWSTTASDGLTDTIGKTSINNGTWHHIVATYDYSTGECIIYIDGKQDTTEEGHRLGELLGLGGMPQGSIGTSVGVTRKTIFSTSFETQSEKNNWSKNNSGATDIRDYVDNDASNVDGSADKGTETNFANCQDTSPDGDFMTIQEADQDAGASTCGKTSGSGSGYYSISANYMFGQVFTATFSGEVQDVKFYGRSSSGTINTKAVICDSTGHILTNGIGNAVGIGSVGTQTLTYTSKPIVQSGQTYWIMIIPTSSSIRLYYDSVSGATSKNDTSNSYSSPTNPTDATSGTTNYRVLYADINNLNYQIDFEYQWTAAVYNMDNEQVCLYVSSHTGSENLLVNYWTGSAWSSLGTITGIGWSNFTATSLTSSTYTIQLKGASESSDSSQDSWNIDATLLHLWTPQGIFDILPSTVLTPKTGSYSIGGTGDFDPHYAAFNRTGIDISGYKNVKVSVWYSYKNTESNDFLGLYYKNNSQWIPIFEVSNPQMIGGQKPWAPVVINISKSISTLVLQFKWRTTATNEYVAIDDLNITGVPLEAGDNFSGVIDEVRIYNRVLSTEQIYQNYLCTKDGHSDKSVIVSEEIKLGDIWKCVVTPNDGIQDDIGKESNIIQIVTYPGGG